MRRLIISILICCCIGCANIKYRYQEFTPEGGPTSDERLSNTKFYPWTWTSLKGLTVELANDATLGVESNTAKPDPNSLRATGDMVGKAGGTAVKTIMEK